MADVQLLREYWDQEVADPPSRRLPLPRDPRFPETVRLAKRIDANHWTAEETVPTDVDRQTFERFRDCAPEAAEIVVRTLTVFLGADEVVLSALKSPPEIMKKEIQDSLRRRENQEVTHSEVYSNLVECILGPDAHQQAMDLDAHHPALQSLHQWLAQYHSAPAYQYLLALGVFELVTFSALFVVPHVLKQKNVCPALGNANNLISRDESDHADASAASLQEAYGSAPVRVRMALAREVRKMLAEGLRAAEPMLGWVFGEATLLGVGLAEAIDWTKWMVNRFARQLNRLKQFEFAGQLEALPFPEMKRSPLPWMDILSDTRTRANFFEVTLATYDKRVDPETLRLRSAEEVSQQPTLSGLHFQEGQLAILRELDAI